MEIVFLIVGLAFAAIGFYVLWDARRFARTAVRTEGLVIGFAVNEGRGGKSGNRATYSPVVRYRYRDEDHQFTGRIGSNHVKHDIGDPVAVLVSPDDPARARLDGPAMQIFGGVLLAVGLGAIGVFLVAFDFSIVSLLIAALVMAALAFQVMKKLRKHDIHGIEDMKSAVASATRGGGGNEPGSAGPDSRPIITDPREFQQRKEKQKTPGWVVGLLLVIGLAVLAGGGFVAKQRSDFLAGAHTATGEVIDFKRRTTTSDGKTSTTWYPVVRYRPPGHDAPVTFRHDTGSSSPAYSRGEKVTVLYTPRNPSEAIIDAGLMNWLGPGVMILVGGVFTLFGGLALRGRLKERRRPSEVELDF